MHVINVKELSHRLYCTELTRPDWTGQRHQSSSVQYDVNEALRSNQQVAIVMLLTASTRRI